jgi:hypothetical protein
MFSRSYYVISDLLTYGLAAELVRAQEDCRDYALHHGDEHLPDDLLRRYDLAYEMLLGEVLMKLNLEKGQAPNFKSKLIWCEGVRIYLFFEPLRWRFSLVAFSDGAMILADEQERKNQFFVIKQCKLLTADYGDGASSGRILLLLNDGRFAEAFWDVDLTLKNPFVAPYEKCRVIAAHRVLRWLTRHDRRDEVRVNFPKIYNGLENGILTETRN